MKPDGYRSLLRVLASSDGFVLVPVELPGPQGARRLHRWLARHGYRLRRVRFAAEALAVLCAREQGILVYGADPGPDDFGLLSALNQARDRIGERQFPVLWCGSSAWLNATWRGAPDFWSVRTLTRQMPPEPPGPGWARPVWALPLGPRTQEDLRALVGSAREQGDGHAAARLGYELAGVLAGSGDGEGAGIALRDAINQAQDDELRFDLHLLGARLALRLGSARACRTWLGRAVRYAGQSVGKQAQVGLVAASQALAAGRATDAVRMYSGLLPGLAERPLLAARGRVGLGRALMAGGELAGAEAVLRDAITLFQAQGEALGEATALLELGELCRRAGRASEGRDLLVGAHQAFVDNGLRAAEHRTAVSLARLELADDRPDAALRWLSAFDDADARRLRERAMRAKAAKR